MGMGEGMGWGEWGQGGGGAPCSLIPLSYEAYRQTGAVVTHIVLFVGVLLAL
jgi:hypothetical protein